MIVNHKDRNKTNNNFNNLEWVTNKQNSKHAIDNGLCSRCRKVRCLNNGMVFASMKEAAKWCGMGKKAGSLNEYFKNENRKTAGRDPITGEKLKWEFA